jgi:hypothetical protein
MRNAARKAIIYVIISGPAKPRTIINSEMKKAQMG